jgi:SHS2 domain-containing protein
MFDSWGFRVAGDLGFQYLGFTILSVPFEELSHTGDLRYRVTAASREELFAESSSALFATITDPQTLEEREERRITAQGGALEELLIEFLRACFEECTKDEFVARSCAIASITEDTDFLLFRIEALLRGERFDATKHPFRTEIKAVTYHGASVKKVRDGEWEAVFTLDL